MPTALLGTPSRDYTAAYGGVPFVPNPTETTEQALSGNLANMAELYGMAGNINQFQNAQMRGALEANLPDYSSLVAQSSKNIGAQLRGELSPEAIAATWENIGAGSLGTGRAMGGPETNAAFRRALGLSSYELQQAGEQNLTGAIGRTPVATPFDVSSFLTTPEQQFNSQLWANIYASMPNPKAAADAARAAAAGAGSTGSGPMTVTTTRIPGAAGGGSGLWERAPGMEGFGGWTGW